MLKRHSTIGLFKKYQPMKNTHFSKSMIVPAMACFIFTACDPSYNVEYQVQNNSKQQITIHSRYFTSTTIDTNIISSGTKVTLYVEWGLGSTTKSHMESLQSLPFEISIFNREGQPVIKDIQNFSQWHQSYTDRRNDRGVVLLTLRPGDF